jgi:hypothetical protein
MTKVIHSEVSFRYELPIFRLLLMHEYRAAMTRRLARTRLDDKATAILLPRLTRSLKSAVEQASQALRGT